MGPTRFPYGQARGFANQFVARPNGAASASTAGDISGFTAPDVTIGELFYTNNTAALTITNFILQDTANRGTQYEGKVIRVFFLDTATQLANSGALQLAGTNNLIGANNNVELMFSRGSWWETDRVYSGRTEITTFVTNAQSSLNMDGVRVALLNNTGSTTNAITALSNGQVGQEVTFMLVGSNPVRFITGGNLFMTTTNAMLVNASGAYKAVKFDSATWRFLAINSGGAF